MVCFSSWIVKEVVIENSLENSMNNVWFYLPPNLHRLVLIPGNNLNYKTGWAFLLWGWMTLYFLQSNLGFCSGSVRYLFSASQPDVLVLGRLSFKRHSLSACLSVCLSVSSDSTETGMLLALCCSLSFLNAGLCVSCCVVKFLWLESVSRLKSVLNNSDWFLFLNLSYLAGQPMDL